MPFYHKLGDIPNKRHTVFKSKSGQHRYEELFGTIGFVGMSSLLYHTQRPTQVKGVLKSYSVEPKTAVGKNMKSISLKGFSVPPTDDFLESRKTSIKERLEPCTLVPSAYLCLLGFKNIYYLYN